MTVRMRISRAMVTGVLLLMPLAAFAQEPATGGNAGERLTDSAVVLREIMATPDQAIPMELLAKAQCVVIVPGLKRGGFIVGGQYGRGFLTCRPSGSSLWGPPAAIRMEGGSIGFQIGATESDVVLLLMDRQAVDGVLRSKFTLGAGVEAVAGPVGRGVGAATEGTMNARILGYVRSRGVFAGATVGGASIRQDVDENAEMYGKPLTTREVINGKLTPPKAAAELVGLLGKYSKAGA